MKIFSNIYKSDLFNRRYFWNLIALLLVFTLLRIPSLIEPDWYGDEGIYRVIGQSLSQGRSMYVGAFDNKPPLLFTVYTLFANDLFWVKATSLFFGIGALIFLFLVSQELFKKEGGVYISCVLFALLFGLPVLEGNIANAENFMLVFTIAAQYLVLRGIKGGSKLLFWAGILFSLAFLIKIVAIFDFFAAVIFLSAIFVKEKRGFAAVVPDLKRLLLISGFVLPVLVTFLYFFLRGTFPLFFDATFSSNVGYVDVENRFIFPLGFLFIKALALGAFCLALLFYSNRLKREDLFIFSWIGFTLFSAFFSNRPYTHYVLMLLPSFCLLAGYIYERSLKRAYLVLILLSIILLIYNNFVIFRKNTAYYLNYINFVFGERSAQDYQYFFDSQTPINYDIANFVRAKLSPSQNVFIWGDSGQIYALSGKLPPGRYSVSYHITFYPNGVSDTKKALDASRPELLIKMREFDNGLILRQGYQLKYQIHDIKIYERES